LLSSSGAVIPPNYESFVAIAYSRGHISSLFKKIVMLLSEIYDPAVVSDLLLTIRGD
jgi:hypothetical protein